MLCHRAVLYALHWLYHWLASGPNTGEKREACHGLLCISIPAPVPAPRTSNCVTEHTEWWMLLILPLFLRLHCA